MIDRGDLFDASEKTNELLGDILEELKAARSAIPATMEPSKVPGLTHEEKAVIASLAGAWNRFVQLGENHPDDRAEFCQAIHAAQNIIAFRVARRADPEVWSKAVDKSPSPNPYQLRSINWHRHNIGYGPLPGSDTEQRV